MANDTNKKTLRVLVTRLPMNQINWLHDQKERTGLPIERLIRNALDDRMARTTDSQQRTSE